MSIDIHPMSSPLPLRCPVCREPLSSTDRRQTCANGHSYDRARQGYYNLLLSHRKRSKNPGDNQAMVDSRRGFLEQGFYQPVADALNRLCLSQCEQAEWHQPAILDIGCGEGYYTACLEQALSARGAPRIAGVDISKPAIRAACQRSKTIQWLVASGADLPLADASVDLLLCLFTRLMPEEYARVLQPRGQLLVAATGADHLRQLREMIYPDIRPSHFDPARALASYFRQESVDRVNYAITLDSAATIAQLVTMTPHHWRINAAGRERLAALEALTVTVDIALYRFSRL